ncbi:S8 family serine peptidase [Haloferula chungangensis]
MNGKQGAAWLAALIGLGLSGAGDDIADWLSLIAAKPGTHERQPRPALAEVFHGDDRDGMVWPLRFDLGYQPVSRRYVRFEAASDEAELRQRLDKDRALPVVEAEGIRRIVTREMSVRFAGTRDEAGLKALGLKAGPVLDFARGWMTAEAGDPLAALALVKQVKKLPGVEDVEPLFARQHISRSSPDDALFSKQWYLARSGSAVSGSDTNIADLWEFPDGPGLRGAGVRIAIVDDGIETTHPDLMPNIDAEHGKDWNGDDADPSAEAGDYHGTACAGVAAARGGNGIGICGAAPEASIVGLRLIAGPTTDLQEAQAMAWKKDIIDIKSNSWGPDDSGSNLEGPGSLTRAALESATANGRDGRGSIIVWAAGNGGEFGDNSNYDGYANSIHTIAVGASDSLGQPAPYSERGANVLISAPSSGSSSALGVTTTDRIGAQGLGPGDYTDDFEGTSSATALVSGVVALMLEQNPELGWRDVQEILMRSAVQLRPNDPEWIVNGAGFWFHPRLGAGKIDAVAAVEMSEAWVNLTEPSSAREGVSNLGVTIPEGASSGVSQTFTMPSIRCEHVTVKVNISHSSRGNLKIEVISPQGTVSQLSEVHTDLNNNYSNWTFSSVRHWGEDAGGTWMIRVADRSSVGNTTGGTLNSVDLTIHGSAFESNEDPEIAAVHLNGLGQMYDDLDLRVARVDAVDGDGDELTFTYQWQFSEDGLVFDDAVGEVSRTLAAEPARSGKLWRCRVSASDGQGGSAMAFSPWVNLLDRPGYLAEAGEPFAYQSGLVLAAPASFRLADAAVLPEGLVLDSETGRISGMVDPDEQGVFRVEIERFNEAGGVVAQGFELSVGENGGFELWMEGLEGGDEHGLPNLIRYASGASSDPPADRPMLERGDESIALVFEESRLRSDVRMIVESSTTLNGDWSADGIAINEISKTHSLRTLRAEILIDPASDRGFLRLRAVRPPMP